MSENLILPSKGKHRQAEMEAFASKLLEISEKYGSKVSSRGWCYQLEGYRLINKNEFDRVQKIINECREKGYLPIDFVLEEKARKFEGIETPNTYQTPLEFIKDMLEIDLDLGNSYVPDWWEGEKYYIQMIVEKIDLISLFEPVCKVFYIPIANTRGWSSMLQRAEYAKRFKEAEEDGLECVLLYCGDHDPDGLRISDSLRSNLEDLSDIVWKDETEGYDPENLIIDRFGLDYEFIQENHLTWIDNLITGSDKNLADPNHKNNSMPYVQDYLKKYGARKCEANVLITIPEKARAFCVQAIVKYLGIDALDRFKNKRDQVVEIFEKIYQKTHIRDSINKLLSITEEDLTKE